MLTVLDRIVALEAELAHYKDFYEAMRKACPADYIAYKESSAAEDFADKSILAIKDMQKREVLQHDNYILLTSALGYFAYFYQDKYSESGEDYEATDKREEAAIFYSQADAEAARDRLQKVSGIIAEIQKVRK